MIEILISKIIIGKRFRKTIGDVTQLAESIKEIGLLHPVVLDKKHKLIAGRRRIAAFQHLKRKSIPYTTLDLEAIIRGEFDENSIRKDFTAEETADIIEAISKTRLGHRQKKGVQFAHQSKGATKTLVSKLTGKSERTIVKLQNIVKAKRSGDKEAAGLLEKIDNGMSVDFAHKLHQKNQAVKLPMPPLPTGQYNLLYMDFPWAYERDNRVMVEYTTMTLEEGKKMKIAAAKDCVFFFWVTISKIDEGIELLKSWGFSVRSSMAWVKKEDDGPLQTNEGYYVQAAHEILLIAKKGNMRTPVWKPKSVIFAPKSKHSKKPEKFYEIIEKMYPKTKRLEYFARNNRKGWSSFGNQISA